MTVGAPLDLRVASLREIREQYAKQQVLLRGADEGRPMLPLGDAAANEAEPARVDGDHLI